MIKVLITGVAGFIGSNLACQLLDDNSKLQDHNSYQVIGIDNLSYGLKENIPDGINFYQKDIRNKDIYDLFKEVDLVFHLAAKNCINDCQLDPVETADINVKGTVNVFEAARRANVKKVIYAESSAMYEGSSTFPTPENEMMPESFYAMSKLASSYFAKAYKRFHDLKYTALRYFCVYGPVQDYRRTIPPVMSAFIIKLLKGESPIIYGSGNKRRDFVFVDDVNDFHIRCINDPRTDNKTYNLGSGVNHSVFEIYELVSDLLKKRINPQFKLDLPGEAQITLADITEARKVGWKPKTSIRKGLQKAIEYIEREMAAGRI